MCLYLKKHQKLRTAKEDIICYKLIDSNKITSIGFSSYIQNHPWFFGKLEKQDIHIEVDDWITTNSSPRVARVIRRKTTKGLYAYVTNNLEPEATDETRFIGISNKNQLPPIVGKEVVSNQMIAIKPIKDTNFNYGFIVIEITCVIPKGSKYYINHEK